MKKYLIVTLGLIPLLFLMAKTEAKPVYGNLVVTQVISVYDGDTFRADIACSR